MKSSLIMRFRFSLIRAMQTLSLKFSKLFLSLCIIGIRRLQAETRAVRFLTHISRSKCLVPKPLNKSSKLCSKWPPWTDCWDLHAHISAKSPLFPTVGKGARFWLAYSVAQRASLPSPRPGGGILHLQTQGFHTQREGDEVHQIGRRPCGCPLQNYFASSHFWILVGEGVEKSFSLIPPVITQLLSSTYHLPCDPLDNTRKNMLSHLTNTQKEVSQFNLLRSLWLLKVYSKVHALYFGFFGL